MTLPDGLAIDAARAAGRALARPRPDGPELTAIVLSELPVLSPWCQEHQGLISVKYGPLKLPLGALTSFRIGLINTGTEALVAEKFQRPIEVSHAEDARLVSLTVGWRRHGQLHPDDDPIKINDGEHTITIKPPLVNPGDALVLNGLVSATVPTDIRISTRYPNLPAIESLRFSASGTEVTFDNYDVEAKKVRWAWLRKFAPKKFRYRRAAQLRDAIDVLLTWDESK